MKSFPFHIDVNSVICVTVSAFRVNPRWCKLSWQGLENLWYKVLKEPEQLHWSCAGNLKISSLLILHLARLVANFKSRLLLYLNYAPQN